MASCAAEGKQHSAYIETMELAHKMMGVTITERVNITKYVFINIHYLRLKKIDGGHI